MDNGNYKLKVIPMQGNLSKTDREENLLVFLPGDCRVRVPACNDVSTPLFPGWVCNDKAIWGAVMAKISLNLQFSRVNRVWRNSPMQLLRLDN